MYYYGNNGFYGQGYQSAPAYAGVTYGYGYNGAIWIVLFILLVIIIGAGCNFGGNKCCSQTPNC